MGNGSQVNQEIYARFCAEVQGEMPWAYSPKHNIFVRRIRRKKRMERISIHHLPLKMRDLEQRDLRYKSSNVIEVTGVIRRSSLAPWL